MPFGYTAKGSGSFGWQGRLRTCSDLSIAGLTVRWVYQFPYMPINFVVTVSTMVFIYLTLRQGFIHRFQYANILSKIYVQVNNYFQILELRQPTSCLNKPVLRLSDFGVTDRMFLSNSRNKQTPLNVVHAYIVLRES